MTPAFKPFGVDGLLFDGFEELFEVLWFDGELDAYSAGGLGIVSSLQGEFGTVWKCASLDRFWKSCHGC